MCAGVVGNVFAYICLKSRTTSSSSSSLDITCVEACLHHPNSTANSICEIPLISLISVVDFVTVQLQMGFCLGAIKPCNNQKYSSYIDHDNTE